MDSTLAPANARRPKTWLRRLLWIAGVCVATVLLLEGTLRAIAYSEFSWGKPLRRPEFYADRWSDPLYFQLAQRWTNEPGPLPAKIADSRLGWVHSGMDRQEFSDRREEDLGSRRPVLLFGDSFIRCMTNEDNCFEGWMERSPQGSTHCVFNYGVRGYGLDQIALLVRLALPHWLDRNALVAVGIFVEDDLDRAILDYRGWPKPRFSLDERGKLIEPGPLPTPDQYEADHPLWKRSLAWGWLLNSSGWLPASLRSRLARTQELTAEKQRLGGAILARLERDLKRTGVDHFYILFPSVRQCTTIETTTWQEDFLCDWLETQRLPYINVKRDLLRAALEQGRHPREFFVLDGMSAEHLTPDGNEVAFHGLLRGIAGDYDHTSTRQPPHPGELHNLDADDERRLNFESGWSRRFPDAADRERIIMRPTSDQPVRVGCEFSRPAKRFVATAKLLPLENHSSDAPLRLQIRVNDQPVFEIVLDGSKPSADLDIDVFDKTEIEIVATRPDAARASGNALILSRPRFE